MPDFGTLARIDLRDGWPGEASEASGFTPWLADNLTLLGDALGMDLELVAQESPVGSFSLDLLARDIGRDRPVIIENQLESTNHDHLGRLITYAAGHDATVAIWVAASFREEHRQALDWMNRRTDEDTEFFGVVVELLRIDDSPFAVNFRLAASPNGWSKATKASPASGSPSGRAIAYRSFFQALIDQLREMHKFTNARVGQPQSWYAFASGHSGIYYGASFAQGKQLRAEVYMDRPSTSENKELFDRLHARKVELEREFGEPLSWQRLDEKKACRIAVYRTGSINDSDSALVEMRDWLVDHLLRLKKIFGPLLADAIKNQTVPVIETFPSADGER